MDQQVNPKEMEKIVREAGMYEENMSKEEIESYYKAIANSKNTATTENESREFNKSLSMLEEEPTTSNTISETSDHKDDEITEETLSLELDATKTIIEFNEMAKPKERSFPIYERPLKYVNIQNSKEFLDADVELKVKMLYSYHTKMGKLRSRLSRESFFTVPMPKPIIIKEISTRSLEIDDSNTDTYISRSGRQTKRKLYNEDENSLDAFYNKKQKNDEFLKSKSTNKVSSKETAEILPESIQTENIEKVITSVTSQSTPKARRLTNADILEKSVLFADNSPKTNKQCKSKTSEMFSNTTFKPIKRLSRSEEMFEKLKEEVEKKQKQENAKEAFEETLKVSDEEIEVQKQQETEDIINIIDDEPTRKRVPVKRPNIHSRNKSSVSSTGSVDPSKMDDVNLACLSMKKRRLSKVDSPKNGVEATSSTIDVAFEEQCPICLKLFPKKQIEVHAASCGLDENVAKIPKYSSRQKLVCQICDKVFVSNYDAHVKECINRQRQLDKKD